MISYISTKFPMRPLQKSQSCYYFLPNVTIWTLKKIPLILTRLSYNSLQFVPFNRVFDKVGQTQAHKCCVWLMGLNHKHGMKEKQRVPLEGGIDFSSSTWHETNSILPILFAHFQPSEKCGFKLGLLIFAKLYDFWQLKNS